MCKIGDILVVYNPVISNKAIGQHSFIVLDDTNGIVSGVFEYDFISLLLTSYQEGDEIRKEKLSNREGNLHIAKDDKLFDDDKHKKDNHNSFVEANNLFYFSKEKISFQKIGALSSDVFNLIIDFIDELNKRGIKFNQITDKAKKIETLIDNN